MGTKTGIDWTDHTWNPWQGCRKVSAGCANCYAQRVPARLINPKDHAELRATYQKNQEIANRADLTPAQSYTTLFSEGDL